MQSCRVQVISMVGSMRGDLGLGLGRSYGQHQSKFVSKICVCSPTSYSPIMGIVTRASASILPSVCFSCSPGGFVAHMNLPPMYCPRLRLMHSITLASVASSSWRAASISSAVICGVGSAPPMRLLAAAQLNVKHALGALFPAKGSRKIRNAYVCLRLLLTSAG